MSDLKISLHNSTPEQPTTEEISENDVLSQEAEQHQEPQQPMTLEEQAALYYSNEYYRYQKEVQDKLLSPVDILEIKRDLNRAVSTGGYFHSGSLEDFMSAYQSMQASIEELMAIFQEYETSGVGDQIKHVFQEMISELSFNQYMLLLKMQNQVQINGGPLIGMEDLKGMLMQNYKSKYGDSIPQELSDTFRFERFDATTTVADDGYETIAQSISDMLASVWSIIQAAENAGDIDSVSGEIYKGLQILATAKGLVSFTSLDALQFGSSELNPSDYSLAISQAESELTRLFTVVAEKTYTPERNPFHHTSSLHRRISALPSEWRPEEEDKASHYSVGGIALAMNKVPS